MATDRWNFTDTIYFTYSDSDGGEHYGEAVVRFEGYYDPGKISGPPENCYPPEGEDYRTVESIDVEKTDPLYTIAIEAANAAAQKCDLPEHDDCLEPIEWDDED